MKHIKTYEALREPYYNRPFNYNFNINDYVIINDNVTHSFKDNNTNLCIIKEKKDGKYSLTTVPPYNSYRGWFSEDEFSLASDKEILEYKNNLPNLYRSINDLKKYILLRNKHTNNLQLLKVIGYEVEDEIQRSNEKHVMITLENLYELTYKNNNITVDDIKIKNETSNYNLISYRMSIYDILDKMIYTSEDISDCFDNDKLTPEEISAFLPIKWAKITHKYNL